MKFAKKRLLLPLILLAVIAPLVLAFKAFAQFPTTGYDVTVSPIFFDLTANPGDTISTKIRVRNNTNSPLPLNLGVQKLSGDINGNLILKQDKTDTTLAWFNLGSSRIVAKPLEWTDVPFTISIPKDAAYGYYWTITFTQDNTNPSAKQAVSLTGASGVPVLLNVKKAGAKAEAKILQFSTTNYVSEYLPIDFTVKVENTGNIHIKPYGSIFISDGLSKNLAILDVNPGQGNIIPDSARIFTTSWDDGFLVRQPVMVDGQPKIDKQGKTVEEIQINWDKLTSFRIGKYTANLLLVFDNGTKDVPLQSTITFWVFPWKVTLGFIIAVVVIVLGFRFMIKAYIKRELNKRIKASSTKV
jgi:hypothetical protein